MKNLQKLANKSMCKSDFGRLLGIYVKNGGYCKLIDTIVKDNNLNVSHFTRNGSVKKKRKVKKCPVCTSKFEVIVGATRQKIVCSHSCSNTYFRSGENNPNWVDGYEGRPEYVRVCFTHHKKKCVVCGEKNVVAAPHFDGNKKNNKPENFIPLCPTHHIYWHSKFRTLIERKVINYRNKFIREIA